MFEDNLQLELISDEIPNGWKIKTFENVCNGIYDCPHSTPKLCDQGPFLVRTQDIRQGYFNSENAVHVSIDTYKKRVKRATPKFGDIFFSREGTYFGDAAEVPLNSIVCLGQRMVLLRPNNSIVLSSFFRIWINSKPFQRYLKSFRDGTVAERLNLTTIRKLPALVPPLSYQNYVVSSILPFEEKSAVCRNINKTLEEMAQAIFKSWFVDFGPVKAKIAAKQNGKDPKRAAMCAISGKSEDALNQLPPDKQKQLATTASLFPDELVDSEMGLIPKGWEVSIFGDIAKNIRQIIDPNKASQNTPYVGLEHIEKKRMYLSLWSTAKTINSNKSKFSLGDILFGKLRPYFHKVCIAPFEGISSTDILVIRPNSNKWKGYVQFLLNSEGFVEYTNVRSTGTRMPRANWKDMSLYLIAKPKSYIVTIFTKITTSFNAIAGSNVKESRTLIQLRDTLLPKLLTGEISLSDAKKFTKKAIQRI